MKVGVIGGAGAVGAACSMALAGLGVARELVLGSVHLASALGVDPAEAIGFVYLRLFSRVMQA